jgi:hypothetical protein
MGAIDIEREILGTIRDLSVQQQHEVLNFARFLHQTAQTKSPRRSLKGLGTDLNIQVTEADIDEIRQEMWGDFPREIV